MKRVEDSARFGYSWWSQPKLAVVQQCLGVLRKSGSKFSEETKLRNNQRDFVGTGKFSGTARGSCWNLTVNAGLVGAAGR
ncbi:hypothetical protein NL676_002822 [Syzygium grande]|nr:hypothetical protein NL676_002822 [Syzygium grande]